jgi:hypothetical protein
MISKQNEFIKILKKRDEKFYNYWTRINLVDHIQFEFQMLWFLFQEKIKYNSKSMKDYSKVRCSRGKIPYNFALIMQ